MSEMIEKQLRVRKISRGTVIDHLPGGKALEVLDLLGISASSGDPITIAMNIPSSKIGKKDIIKLEHVFLSGDDFNKISLIAPKATINTIQDTKIVEKTYVAVPDAIKGVITCINPTCITNKDGEPVTPSFSVMQKKPLVVRCEYCNRIMEQSDVSSNFK